MNTTAGLPVVGVDLAKSVFELAIADHTWRVVEQRLARGVASSFSNVRPGPQLRCR